MRKIRNKNFVFETRKLNELRPKISIVSSSTLRKEDGRRGQKNSIDSAKCLQKN